MTINFTGAAGADVDCGNDASLRITGAFTVMAWVCLDTDLQNIDLVSKQKTGARGFTLQTDDDPPNDTWGTFYAAKNGSQVWSSGWTASPLVMGQWYHLAGQFVPSTAVQVWLDGVLSNEKTSGITATMHDPANNVTLGGRPDDIANVDGRLEDVRIYNRNLSAAEMLKLLGELVTS